MSAFVYDTNCLIALQLDWHEHHVATMDDWELRQSKRQAPVMVLRCLAEFYAVCTRLSDPRRPTAAQASRAVARLAAGRTLVDLSPQDGLAALAELGRLGVAGGQLYDGLIAACARQAGARELVTWNLRHFACFGGPDLRIVNPLGEQAAG